MAQSSGAVSIVIPPWNGVFGKYLSEKNNAPAQAASETSEAQ
jgi:hypothetical protein